MAANITNQEIKDFVRKVRIELKGLSIEDQLELTETLESDLLDRRASEGTKFNLGSPTSFANELAESAGLTLHSNEIQGLSLKFLKTWRMVSTYFATLEPAWAIIRGYLFYAVVFSYFAFGGIQELPYSAPTTMLMYLFIVLSVFLSIKKFKVMKYPVIALNIIGLVAAMFMGTSLQVKIADYKYYAQTRGVENAVLDTDGNLHPTLCAYDKLGNRLEAMYVTDTAGYTLVKMERNFDGWHCPSSKPVEN